MNLSHLTPATNSDLKTLKGVIYLIYDRKRDMGYIGQTHLSFWRRYVNGQWWVYTRNPVLANADGHASRYLVYILEHGQTRQDLNRLEAYYIGALNTLHPAGFNFQLGGDAKGPTLEPTKRLISERNSREYLLYKDGQPIRVRGLVRFCKTHGLSCSGMQNMIHGRTLSCGGYTISPAVVATTTRLKSTYVFSHPEHGKHCVTNLSVFCRHWHLNTGSMRGLITDYVQTCHGWTLVKAESNIIQRCNPDKATRYQSITIQKVSDASCHTLASITDVATLIGKHPSTVRTWLRGRKTSIKDWILISTEKAKPQPWVYTPRARRSKHRPIPVGSAPHST